MTRPRPLTRAEQLALEETPESQDSQAILDALKAEFRAAPYHDPLALQPQPGIESDRLADDDAEAEAGDFVISSPRQAVHRQDTSSPKKQRQLAPHGPVATPHGDVNVNNLTGTSTGTGTIHRVGREDPRTHQPTSRPGSRQQDLDDAVIAASSPFGRNAHSPSPPHNHDTSNQSDEPPAVPIGAGRPQAKRMDTSQQTPTQLNVERDYGQFYAPPRSSPLPDTLRSHDERERTLQADETGAVNFGNLSPGVRPSSQVSEDAGFENTRGEWRVPDVTSQQRSSHGYTPLKPGGLLPETPMPPKNPFAVRHNADGGVPFAGTQLFEQTPVVTSAIKLHSPTSSRPSPNILPDAISLNIIETSPLRNRDNVSSPTVVHTSSPSRPNNIAANAKKLRVSPIQEEALDDDKDAQDDMIPESPTAQPLRPYGNRQPQAHYEPMKKSQERKAIVEVPQAIDSDSDDARNRRRKKKMEKIRHQTAEEMARVRVQMPTRSDLSQSRNRKRRKLSSGGEEEMIPTENASLHQTELANAGNELRSSHKASSLPEQSLSAGSTKATPRDAIVGNGGKRVAAIRPGKSKEATSEEMIPATSPVRSLSAGAQRGSLPASEPELPPLIENETREKEAQSELHTSSLPPPRRHAQRIYGRQAQSRRRHRIITSSEPDERASAEPDPEAHQGVEVPRDAPAIPTRSAVTRRLAKQGEPLQTSNAESELPKSSPPSLRSAATGAPSLRTQMRERSPLTPVHRRAVDRGAHTSSSLTALSTPVVSEKNTPDTQASLVFDQPKSTASVPSPAQSRKTRTRKPGRESSEKTPQQAAKPVKTSMQSARVEPSSTDELQQSPSSSAFELGISSLRSSRIFKQSIGSTFRGRRLFEGMVFAISMSPDKGNQKTRANLETKIKQAGGLILETGFEELFEPSTVMSTYDVPVAGDGEALSLSKPSLSYGFTALIADNHSRKVKYMQALALGLPCLAYQWVMTCLSKGALIDWEPYLLAAGSSAVLGNAVRSRCLRRYDAGDARLVETVEQRQQLLAGEKLLAVVDESRTRNEGKKKKSDVEKKPYMFLAQALGPSISWVSTIQQARELLEAHDKAGKPYTWLYMDESIGTVESVLAISGPAGKKRRRSQGPLATRNIRVLCDELMIQSLILGRMAEQDEMDYAGEKS
ncbi:hypothetical protein THARTR1_06143 [Trichoderma harzianum]|uniref:BRCT domain-containing protein n=1 Tax=Trichoderma harzianum TaxID=5544 RepID=A0A2K0U6Q2_TRIHA|nr:hypothetical protein THARTR1_06143 [Trichoderma harzianum]